MDMVARRARVEELLASPLEHHAELRSLLLPDGEDGGPTAWLPHLPDADDDWRALWGLVGEALVAAFDAAEGDERAHAVSVMAVAPHESSTTRLLSIVQENTERRDIVQTAVDGVLLGLGPDALAHLRPIIASDELDVAGRAVDGLVALPPSIGLPTLAEIVADAATPLPTRLRALAPLRDGEHTEQLETLRGVDDPTIATLVKAALRPDYASIRPPFVPDLPRFVVPRHQLSDYDKSRVGTVVTAAVDGHANGTSALLDLAGSNELLSLALEGFSTNDDLRRSLIDTLRSAPDGPAAFVGREVFSRDPEWLDELGRMAPCRSGRGVLGEVVVGLRGGPDARDRWRALAPSARVDAAEWVSSWRGDVPEGLAELFLVDPAARVVAAGVHLLADGLAPGGAEPIAAELRAQLADWGGRRPASANDDLTKAHAGKLRLESDRHKILGWFGEGSYIRFLRKAVLDGPTLAACALFDGLCGGFEEGPDDELFQAALAGPAPALRIEAMLRWKERGKGTLPSALDKDPDSKVRNIYRRLR